MGVHKKEQYGKIKELLDIPPEEPIFILRGQDVTALLAIDFYTFNSGSRGGPQSFIDDLQKVGREFRYFAEVHPEAMKEPD